MQGGEAVHHLALQWDEAEIRRNAALLQQLYQGQGQATAHPHLLAVLGLTDVVADATRAAAHVGTADAVGVSGAQPGASSAAWPCHTGLLRGSLQESNILYQEIIALKIQLQDIHHGLQQAHSPGQTKQECEQGELKQDQQQHGAGSFRRKKSQPVGTDSDDDWGRDLEPREPRRRGRPLKQAGRYSKNYEAIKRYRAKKKGMVEGLQAQLAGKQQQLVALQQQHASLQQRQAVLESAVAAQDDMLSQFQDLHLSIAEDSSSDGPPQSAAMAEADTATGPARSDSAMDRDLHKNVQHSAEQVAGVTCQSVAPCTAGVVEPMLEPGTSESSGCYSTSPTGPGAAANAAAAAAAAGQAQADSRFLNLQAAANAAVDAARSSAPPASPSPGALGNIGSSDWAGICAPVQLRHRRHQKANHVRDLAALLATYKQYVSECAALMCVIHLDKQQQEQHEGQKPQQEQGQKKQKQEQQGRGQGQGSPLLKCEGSSQRLQEQHQEVQQQQGHAARAHSNNGSSSSTTITSGSPQAVQTLTFPPQPFSVIEVINCWRIAKHGAVPPEVAGAAKKEGGDVRSLGELQINLETGRHEVVPVQHWHNAASEVTLRPEQLQQLAAGWQLLVTALRKLNKEREQLKQQLEAVMLNTTGDACKAQAGPCSSQQQEAPLKFKPSRAFARHDSASSTSSESVAHQDNPCGATGTGEPPTVAQASKSGCLPLSPAATAAAPGMDEQVDSELAELAWGIANVQQATEMMVDSPPRSTSRSGLAAGAAANGAAGSSACPARPSSSSDMPVAAGSFAVPGLSESFASVAERWVVLDQYGQLADAVERNLLQGRAVVSMFGWALWQVFNDEQMGRLSVRSWPYWPLARAIVACLLGNHSVLLEKNSC